jgi:hypothetical protein
VKWDLSILDFAWHAIDERADHPIGVFKAECGHLLLMVTPLHTELYGRACEECAGAQLAGSE